MLIEEMALLNRAEKKMEIRAFKKVKYSQVNSKDYNRQANFRFKKCKHLLASNLRQIVSQYIDKCSLVLEAKQ